MRDIWEQARAIDSTLQVSRSQWRALFQRELRLAPFSRELLFSRMRDGKPALFANVPAPVRRARQPGVGPAVWHALVTGLPRDRKVRVRCGHAAIRGHLTLHDLLERWAGRRARVSVTDLHIRGTRVMDRIDCSRLSDFNLLAGARGRVGYEEMLTAVISSAGTYTDSHTEDPDGSNHCFVGRKLWLVWDTFLGLARNLEDVERCDVRTAQAAFDIGAFLSVPGSRWFVVEPAQTLFLPGHLAHKS